jgi:2-polyprenyl-3-methyl-5-hydroxy-6-metoxy-1,4-benzoquinol methylase
VRSPLQPDGPGEASSQTRASNAPADLPVCPICRAPDTALYSSGRDRLFGLAKGEFPLYRCRSCGCTFQHPLPDSSSLAAFYPNEYWWAEKSQTGSSVARLFTKMEKHYREFVTGDHVRFLEMCARKYPGSGKLLLDIGCGSGTFLHVARSHGFVSHGMDSSASAVEIARTQYGLVVRNGAIGSDVWGANRFDIVTMFHVLEHLPDPALGISYAAGLLKPEGILIIQVPNISSVQARLFRNAWCGLDVPRHVINFTPKAVECLLSEMGFEYFQSSRFSLRDNPASIASSLALWLDPVRRKGRGAGNPVVEGLAEIAYFGLFLLAIPFAFLESALGRGGTIWVCARKSSRQSTVASKQHVCLCADSLRVAHRLPARGRRSRLFSPTTGD